MEQQTTRQSALSPFGAELKRLLDERGMSARQLADHMHYTPSWLSKVMRGPVPPELAQRCDEALEAHGRLIALAGAQSALRPAQLPVVTARFVGQGAQLREVARILAGQTRPGNPAVVAIDGLAGVGKSTLALRAAHDAAERYPDGQLYVDLRGLAAHPTYALEEFLTALGVQPDNVPAGLDQRASLYRSMLAPLQVLVVLDNAASSEQVLPLLPGSQGCGVVLTSRQRLTGLALRTDAALVTLEPMTAEDAAELLGRVLGQHRVDAEPDATAELARRCGYLPLALRIAAERAVVRPQLRVSDLVADLAGAARPLDGLDTDDGHGRGVRAVFDSSFRTLDAETAGMFRLLGLHRGPRIGGEAAAALAGVDLRGSRRALQRLAEVHLVQEVAADRYRLHNLVLDYAAERADAELPGPNRRAAAARLTGWYLHTADAAGRALAPFRLSPLRLSPPEDGIRPIRFADGVEALRWCKDELDNLVPIVQLAVDEGLPETAWQLPLALWDFLLLRKPGRIWVRTHELALRAAQSLGDRRAEGWVETYLAEALRWQRRYDSSADMSISALTIQRDLGDPHGQAWALAGAALLAVDRGDIAAARERLNEALPLFERVQDRHGEALTLSALGDLHRVRGGYEDALRVLRQALAVALDIDDQPTQATILAKIADVYASDGDRIQALRYLDRSLTARRRACDRWGEADTLRRQGEVLRQTGRARQARQAWGSALRIYDALEDPRAEDIRSLIVGDNADMTSDHVSPDAPRGRPEPHGLPDVVDTKRAAPARVYDFLLGGSYNFAVDRATAEHLVANNPDTRHVALQQRAWLRRAITLLRLKGVRQFLDIGSGIPTVGNVHEIAQQDDPTVRVVYVDNDPVAYHTSRKLLQDAGNHYAAAIIGDARDPDGILNHQTVRGMLDLRQPVALIFAAVGHFLTEADDPVGILGTLRDALAPGSWLALSHLTYADQPDYARATARVAEGIYQHEATERLILRSRDQIDELFTGWEMLPPGLTWITDWWPEAEGMPPREESGMPPHRSWSLGGVAYLPADGADT